MIDNTKNNNIKSNAEEVGELTNISNTENSLRVESLQNANQQATDSLVERMIEYQEDKVNPGVSVTKDGALDLKEGNKS